MAGVGLAHPFTREIRPITFDQAQASGREDEMVLAHLGHRLVSQATRLLRAEIWASAGDREVQRVTARRATPGAIDQVAIIAHARVVLTGSTGHRLHEEVITAGGVVRNRRFARLNVGETTAVLAAGTNVPASAPIADALAQDWEDIEAALYRALEVRASEVADSLARKLAARAEEERRTVREILEELRATISAELAAAESAFGVQLELFSTDERAQVERDHEALRRRLAEIPGEIVREVAAVDSRYATPVPRLFPAAVTILVPAELDGGS
jgi:hypothetical protein